MWNKFRPDLYVKSVFDIDFKKLKEDGIKCIYTDLDNTLVAHDVALPTNEIIELVEEVKQHGLDFIIVSNNTRNRVTIFAEKLNVPYKWSARKPLGLTYNKLKEEYGYEASEVVSIGDQLLTDVFGGNRQGLYTVLVEPIHKKDIIYTKVNRQLEKFVFYMLDKKNLLTKGKYDV